MSIVAEYELIGDAFVLGHAVDTAEVTVSIDSVFGDDGRPIAFCWVEGDLERFEVALEEDPTVESASVLTRTQGRRYYRIAASKENGTVVYSTWVQLGAEWLSTAYRDGKWISRMRFPDREALVAFRDWCEDNGISFGLRRLTDQEAMADETLLTAGQREALTLAYERGFFEIPRKATMADLADELGVSEQAVSQRLRRGYARLVEGALIDE